MTAYQPKRTEADVLAVQACIAGTASEDQQRRAMNWIMSEACMILMDSYTPGDPYATAHCEGRRYAGIQIRAMTDPLALEAAKKADQDKLKKRQSK